MASNAALGRSAPRPPPASGTVSAMHQDEIINPRDGTTLEETTTSRRSDSFNIFAAFGRLLAEPAQ